MSTKRCAYKGCGSFTTMSYPSPETFYAFPKDPERCKTWLQLGACDEDLPLTMRYFCSKHFDETKYVAHNQRRKQLLASAVPWPYKETAPKRSFKLTNTYQFAESTVSDDNTNDVSDIVKYEENEGSLDLSTGIITDTLYDEIQGYQYPEYSQDENYEPVTSDEATTTNQTTYEKPAKLPKTEHSSNYTTFIYKGQEYVQMPKDEYIHEKLALMDKIKAYEEIFRNVRHLVNDAPL